MVLRADYVIVGAGSAGCALAYRLGEAGHSVIVIEHGGSDAGPIIQMPAALSLPMNMRRYDWGFASEPEPHLDNRRLVVPRGKVIGGSSSINGMVYVRGHAHDYDHWEESGARGWSYADVLPYFRRMEHWHGPEASDWRGSDGPLHVQRAQQWHPLHHAFVAAGAEAGYPTTPDYNGAQQEGFAAFDMTVWRGRRWSAANAYLKPAMRYFNVRIAHGMAERVAFDGTRATGVELKHRGRRETVHARREVILAASSINTPKLLMLSGIGPGQHLQEHGIELRSDRPGVGQNLQDHLEVYIQYASTKPFTLYRYWNLLGKASIGARWLLTRTGLGASNQFESCAFIRSRAGIDYPDIQMHFIPIAMSYDGQTAAEGHGFQVHTGPMRATSRGAVTLASPDPAEAPRILFNYMSQPEDWRDFRTAIRLVREIFRQPAMADYVKHEIQPGGGDSDAELDAFIRAEGESAYHPCGTARMGDAGDPMAVVDPECRVIGVEGLRVADSSIFPRVTNGNTNAPSILVGEKAADLILGRAPLPRDDRAPWLHPDWRNAQR